MAPDRCTRCDRPPRHGANCGPQSNRPPPIPGRALRQARTARRAISPRLAMSTRFTLAILVGSMIQSGRSKNHLAILFIPVFDSSYGTSRRIRSCGQQPSINLGGTALNVVLLPRAEPPAGGAPKVFAVLEAIASVPRPLTVSELAALLGVPKPTMHRIVRQLDAEGLLQREPHTRLYGPGPRLVSFAHGRRALVDASCAASRRARSAVGQSRRDLQFRHDRPATPSSISIA